MRCNGSNWAVYSPGSRDGFTNDWWALWAGVIMRLEHHLVGGYVRYISPHIIIIIIIINGTIHVLVLKHCFVSRQLFRDITWATTNFVLGIISKCLGIISNVKNINQNNSLWLTVVTFYIDNNMLYIIVKTLQLYWFLFAEANKKSPVYKQIEMVLAMKMISKSSQNCHIDLCDLSYSHHSLCMGNLVWIQ